MRTRTFKILLSVFLALISAPSAKAEESTEQLRQRATAQLSNGNARDALTLFRELLGRVEVPGAAAAKDLHLALQAVSRLGEHGLTDELLESTIKTHSTKWQVLKQAAEEYGVGVVHYGYSQANEFQRGNGDGSGKYVNAQARDKLRALQLMVSAMPLVESSATSAEKAGFYLYFADLLSGQSTGALAWKLQELTDLTQLPDYEEQLEYRESTGAPVDKLGKPIFYSVPSSFSAATNDGERWRGLLQQAIRDEDTIAATAQLRFADFLRGQFDVSSIVGYYGAEKSTEEQDSVMKLQTLADDETISRLATGVKRFTLPKEFSFIEVYVNIAKGSSGEAERALNSLAEVYENRRQYEKAAERWKESIARFGKGSSDYKQSRLDQIIGAWGRFESTKPAALGMTPNIQFRFRNGTGLHLVAHEILADKLLTDLKEYLKSNPAQLDYRRTRIDDLGIRLVEADQSQYLGKKVADWNIDLDPAEHHFDSIADIKLPLEKAGGYLITAEIAGGNKSAIAYWLNDTAILKKNFGGKSLFFVADAKTGRPRAGLNVEFFGYRTEYNYSGSKPNFRILTQEERESSDNDGLLELNAADGNNPYNWMAIAKGPKGEFGFLGFSSVWYGHSREPYDQQVKAFAITNQPAYRPKQTVKFHVWIGQGVYEEQGRIDFAGRKLSVLAHNPRAEKIYEQEFVTDTFGGVSGELQLPESSVLGAYSLSIRDLEGGYDPQGAASFLVEEYKKPEFEVTIDTPERPVALGDRITAKVKAKYYFGAPVTKARVHYKVLRSTWNSSWFPPCPWDWLYGAGYSWFAPEYRWYPGFDDWGIRPPARSWYFGYRNQAQPELVQDVETEIGKDGTVEINIDSAIAKQLYAEDDHSYSITVEVTDESRRTIVGTGAVIASRKPFSVYAWTNHGYYKTGDTIEATFTARTPDSKPVKGQGVITLYRVTYDESQAPKEEELAHWNVPTDDQGQARQKVNASAPGQYRFSYKLSSNGKEVEGGYLLSVYGESLKPESIRPESFRFNEIEILPEKQEYAPGENLKLAVNTAQADSTVLLFIRTEGGISPKPRILRTDGKTSIVDIEIKRGDMPNFFVEAMTIHDAEVHTAVREIVVPPEQGVLNLEIQPDKAEYRPGEKAKLKLKLTTLSGQPFVGSTVVSVYDKALEYISAGNHTPEIRSFFWSWKRAFSSEGTSSLSAISRNQVFNNQMTLSPIGRYGNQVRLLSEKGQSPLRRMKSQDADAFPAAPQSISGLADAAKSRDSVDLLTIEESAVGGESPPPSQAAPQLRKDFADSALWSAGVVTKADGSAELELLVPDNLTSWTIRSWALGKGSKVAQASAEMVSTKNVLIRLQTPRFFTEQDEVLLSGNVHNYLKSAQKISTRLILGNDLLEALDPLTKEIEVAAGGEVRVDWRVKVKKEGEAIIRAEARSGPESDAVEIRIPVQVHGMLKTETVSRAIRPNENATSFTIDVPKERRPEQSKLIIRYSPSIAAALVEALPYLVSYAYGCTEQTLNRFLPTIIVQKVLRDMQINLADLKQRRSNLNSQELGNAAERNAQWKQGDENPVFDEAEVAKMVKVGLGRLESMQLGDGGWGWFYGGSETSGAHTTAVVVHGLQIAQEVDVKVDAASLQRGIDWLKQYQAAETQKIRNAPSTTKPYKAQADNLDAFVFMILTDAGAQSGAMTEFLYRDRLKLSIHALSMLGLGLEKLGKKDQLQMVMKNIEQFLVEDDSNQTAYLKLNNQNYWWYWYGSDIETQSYYLKLLSRVAPERVTASRLVKYLLNNRKNSTYWNSTRDTATAIEAISEYLKASKEDAPDMVVEILFDGKKKKEVSIGAANLFAFDDTLEILAADLTDGSHTVEVKKKGKGPLYLNAYLTNFTLEDMIAPAGLELKVERKFYRLVPVDGSGRAPGAEGQVVSEKREKYRREPLVSGAEVKSGDLIEVELIAQSKNDYEYILLEDMKAAGFEAVEVRSGYLPGPLLSYAEYRDNRVAVFLRELPRGSHSLTYRLRAEIPGSFSALPVKATAMYAPELRGNSGEHKLKVLE